MKHINLSIVCLLMAIQLFGQPINELEAALYNLPDIVFESITTPNGYGAAYELKIKQPLDHKNPDKGYFYQRAFLSHRSFEQPTVICTEGYNRPYNRIYELTELIDGNQIDVEHRFFGESMPDESIFDYDYLNLEQATADLHHINELFRQIYNGKWLSTGISKGGQTTIFYRYFYPNDVDVSVPYVAPLNLALEEERIYTFLDTVGTSSCRNKLYDVQQTLLKKRTEVLPLMEWYAKGARLSFTRLSLEEAFEYAVLEYPFSFWQLGGDCDKIPGNKASLQEKLTHMSETSGIDFFADASMDAYASHYYQAGAEMGYYSYNTEDFKGLLKALPASPNPSAIFMPEGEKKTFDGELVNTTHQWLKSNGDRFIYINGNSDTWSATAVRPSDDVDALWLFMPGKDHGRARIKNMTPLEREQVVNALERWLEIDIK